MDFVKKRGGNPSRWAFHAYADVVYFASKNKPAFPHTKDFMNQVHARFGGSPWIWISEAGVLIRLSRSTDKSHPHKGEVRSVYGKRDAQASAAKQFLTLGTLRQGNQGNHIDLTNYYEVYGQKDQFDSAVINPPDPPADVNVDGTGNNNDLANKQFRPVYCVLTRQKPYTGSLCNAPGGD